MASPSINDPLGYDAYLAADLDRTGRSATGAELVDAAIPHRLMCRQLPKIGAPGGVVDFGEDVREWIGEPLDDASAATKATLIDVALQRDERIAKTDVVVSAAPPGVAMDRGGMADLLIALTYTLITGQTVSRVLGVNGISVEFLAGG